MPFEIIIYDTFEKAYNRLVKKYRSLPNDFSEFINELEENPTLGEPLGRDCYKVRMAISSKGKGKSGGSRIITCVKIIRQQVHLLTIYDKSEKNDISAKELNNLLNQIEPD